jgi:hypothetical protein
MLATCSANTCGTTFDPACPDGGIADLSAPPDLTAPVDLEAPLDLTVPIDLAVRGDLAGNHDLAVGGDLAVERDLSVALDLSADATIYIDPHGLSLTGGACAFVPSGELPHGAWAPGALALLLLVLRRRKKIA